MSFAETDWDDLLQAIQEGRVIPIVGSELLRVADGDGETSLDRYLAQRLAVRLGVPSAELPEDGALNQVVCQYLGLSAQSKRERVYGQLRLIMNDVELPITPALKTLAAIRHFNLYVTTSVDSLLEKALASVRSTNPDVLVYTPASSDVHDLPCEMQALRRPVVFHLMGRISSTPDYVITDEDMLEFLNKLQSGKRPNLLFDELKVHHLLLLGCSHPDWLARFFIRLVKGAPLSTPRACQEFLADRRTVRDHNLTYFLQHFSYGTQLFLDGDAAAFVEELGRRYEQKVPKQTSVTVASPTHSENEPAQGAFFLSYANEDGAIAIEIAGLLRSIGADVWLDNKGGLSPGGDWDQLIQTAIRCSAFFLPLITKHTEDREEGFFRKEWYWAEERSLEMHKSVSFIIPIVLDDLDIQWTKVPKVFPQKHCIKFRPSEGHEAFVREMIRLLREYRKRGKHLP
jgi:hypothetical protein